MPGSGNEIVGIVISKIPPTPHSTPIRLKARNRSSLRESAIR